MMLVANSLHHPVQSVLHPLLPWWFGILCWLSQPDLDLLHYSVIMIHYKAASNSLFQRQISSQSRQLAAMKDVW